MGTFIGIVILLFIIGLFFRKKGDTTLDTLGEGAKGCLWIIIIIVLILFVLSNDAARQYFFSTKH